MQKALILAVNLVEDQGANAHNMVAISNTWRVIAVRSRSPFGRLPIILIETIVAVEEKNPLAHGNASNATKNFRFVMSASVLSGVDRHFHSQYFSCWNELLLISFKFSAAVDQNSLRSDHVGATKGQKCTKTTEGLIFLCMSSGHVAAIAAQRCERGDLVAPTAPLCCQGHALPR